MNLKEIVDRFKESMEAKRSTTTRENFPIIFAETFREGILNREELWDSIDEIVKRLSVEGMEVEVSLYYGSYPKREAESRVCNMANQGEGIISWYLEEIMKGEVAKVKLQKFIAEFPPLLGSDAGGSRCNPKELPRWQLSLCLALPFCQFIADRLDPRHGSFFVFF